MPHPIPLSPRTAAAVLRRALHALAVGVLVAACADPDPTPGGPGGPGGPTEPPPAAVVPDSLALAVVPGGRLWLHGDARDSLRTPPDTLVRFAVDDPGVATVDTMGQVTGVRAGRAVVTATAAGRSARLAVVMRPVRYRAVHPSFEDGGCALTTDGEALCWGRNDNGILDVETLRDCGWRGPRVPWSCGSWGSAGPTFVRTRARFASLRVGWGRRCGVTADGRALCWGARPETTDGLIACADTLSRGRCDYAPREDPDARRWAALDVGALRFVATTCALDDAGAPWCWGYDWSGNAGAGHAEPAVATVPAPVQVPGAPTLRALALGPVVSCGLDAGDAVWCWGYPYYFGDDTATTGRTLVSAPTRAASGMRFATLAMHDGGCRLTREGEAWCWWFATRPTAAAPGLRFTSISAGEVSACGVTVDGEGWCWAYGRQPHRVTGELRVRTLAVQELEACGMGVDGVAYCLHFDAVDPDPARAIVGPARAVAGQG